MIEFHPKARHCGTCISSTYEAKIEVLCEFKANQMKIRSMFQARSVPQCMWRSVSILSFHTGLRGQAQVPRLGGKYLSPLSHLEGL